MSQGQAELDLPDPLQHTKPAGAGGGSGSAPGTEDDLLAQLAGDEIDRLLADADVVKPSPVAARTRANASPAVSSNPVATTTDTTDLPPQDVEAELNAQLESLFKTIDKPDGQTSATSPPLETPASADAAQAVDQTTTEPVELSNGSDSAAEAFTHPASEKVELDLNHLPDARRSALGTVLLKPLELLNAPLSGASPSTRATIGKMAILTLFNAVAVIVYVIFFRAR